MKPATGGGAAGFSVWHALSKALDRTTLVRTLAANNPGKRLTWPSSDEYELLIMIVI
jgi:hypothetical protein